MVEIALNGRAIGQIQAIDVAFSLRVDTNHSCYFTAGRHHCIADRQLALFDVERKLAVAI